METGCDAAPRLTAALAAPAAVAAQVADVLRGSAISVACSVAVPEEIAGACADRAPRVAIVGLADGSSPWRARIEQLIATLEGICVVAIVRDDCRASGRRLCSAGVDGIVHESELSRSLVPTVRAVTAGQLTVPRTLRRSIAPPNFSVREKQVLGLIVLGLTNGEIAAKLWLAESTVKSHLASAFNKLGVRSRSEAAALILDPEQGLGTGILAISQARLSIPDAVAS